MKRYRLDDEDISVWYESSDPIWHVTTTPTAPEGCSIYPGAQGVQVSTTGQTQLESVSWQMTCASTPTGAITGYAVAGKGGKGKDKKVKVKHKATFKDKKTGKSKPTQYLTSDIPVKAKKPKAKKSKQPKKPKKPKGKGTPTGAAVTGTVVDPVFFTKCLEDNAYLGICARPLCAYMATGDLRALDAFNLCRFR